MKTLNAWLLGIALSLTALQVGAGIIDIGGGATASGFAERPTGFIGTPIPGPFGSLSAQFQLSYDDSMAPLDGALGVALTSFGLDIGAVSYDPSNSSAILYFEAGALTGLAVGANTSGGPDVLAPASDDFLFSNIDGIQVFQYTVAGVNGAFTGLFETLFTPGADPDIGDVSVAFGPIAAVAAPAPAALVLVGLLLLAGLGRSGATAPA